MSNVKCYRVKTNPNSEETVINVKMAQHYDMLDVLSVSIKLNDKESDVYIKNSAKYGVIVGRVLANNGYGVPNAKISVFIPKDEEETDTIINYYYPFTTVTDKTMEGVRYNLLEDYGTFFDKNTLLDNLYAKKIFEKYYKYTATTNESGDYMIYGVPVGNQLLHMDIDLSNIGIISQTPRDMIGQGFSKDLFESYTTFKKSTDLDSLPQILTQNASVYVYPFTGDDSDETVSITRHDFNLSYEFKPTCVFLGSVIGDTSKNGISKECRISENSGDMTQLTTGRGKIEMIRKTIDGNIETLNIDDGNLIDGNGTWYFNIPMNLNYKITDEYGKLVDSDEFGKGIPTETQIRFRITMDSNGLNQGEKRGSYLIPNNPSGTTKADYNFNNSTNDESFVVMKTNKVYSIKQFIPRYEKLGI
ncbi:MAG: hypothetical protein HUJ68_06080, partial [Clostridia bacterium]|nr:hypothetical protein [Clostridia bacterium]